MNGWLIGFRHYNLYVSSALILMFIFGTDNHCANGPTRIYQCPFVLPCPCALSRPLQFWLLRQLSLARPLFCMYAPISHCFAHHRAKAYVSIEHIIHIPLTYAYVCTCEPMISRSRVVYIVVPCPCAQSTPHQSRLLQITRVWRMLSTSGKVTMRLVLIQSCAPYIIDAHTSCRHSSI